ncbi:hypothetical protein [Bradyrhizobium canariense]|uniref:AbiTii domain-containing protein n=1 Tax=Bradyrhizobium canariense TaxID=255045 RepID=A0A1X3FHY4_9BRAD|nr:hypothetical protein [Bradyrhizobium canariense]OSI66357.1 hypothetical protein BSZ22_27950 [Bradyrhizobium canariense]OSI77745.1 hypothetical protein BSZ23_20740 [Bradyrhizobium canariense]OSI86716.1 hypothetical protein BSZ24_28630 [Bradyrhizobium canariense]OSI88903.1 hypothetical protein BSZ25_22210 [Bradyrhizobium canariense]OSJ01357.1 hypothetical protein BSZ16_19630 [Bradyrhizobium canariense]
MSILREIQAAILQENPDLGTILLKLRFLASRLGSEPLEDWVKYEAEGYPKDADIPAYRVAALSFRGSWSGPFGSGINNAPIPTALVEKHASKEWTRYKIKESIATVQEMAASGKTMGINASNLILLLQGKVYEGYACNSIDAEMSSIAFQEIVQTVRARILELTIELEKRVPEAIEVTLQQVITSKTPETAAAVTQIFNQTVYGNVTHVIATDGAQVTLAITAGDTVSMVSELARAGLPEGAAKQITDIVASEGPPTGDEPLGPKALGWIKQNAPKAASGAWKIGSAVATDLLKEAALRYYGLK